MSHQTKQLTKVTQHQNLAHAPIKNKWVNQLRKLAALRGYQEKTLQIIANRWSKKHG